MQVLFPGQALGDKQGTIQPPPVPANWTGRRAIPRGPGGPSQVSGAPQLQVWKIGLETTHPYTPPGKLARSSCPTSGSSCLCWPHRAVRPGLSAELPDGEGCKGPSPHSWGLPLPQQELCLPKPPEMSPRAQGSPGVCRRQGAEPSHTDRFPSGVCKPPWLVALSTPGWGRGFFPSGPRGVFQAHKPTKLCPPRPPRLRQHLSGCGHRRWRRGLCGELRGGAGGRPALTSVCARTPLQRRALGPLRLRRAGRRLGRATQLL